MTQANRNYERRKEIVAAVVNRNESPSLVARVYNVPLRTVFDWLARYRHGGWHALKEGRRSGRPRKVSGVLLKWLFEAIRLGDPRQYQFDFCLWTLGIIRKMLKVKWDVDLSISGVSRLLRHLGLSPQKPVFRAYQQNPAEIENYLKQEFPQLRRRAKKLGAVIFFVDESTVRTDNHRGRTWGEIGKAPVAPASGDRFAMPLISAVSPRGDMYFGVIDGRMNSEKFVGFLEKLRADVGRPIVVIADNAAYHTSQGVRGFVSARPGQILLAHLPRYAPELNPDEQVWNHLKARLSQMMIDSFTTMRNHVFRILANIQRAPGLIRSFFQMPSTKYACDAC